MSEKIKLPPTNAEPNVDLERFVLSSMLLKNGAVVPSVQNILSADDFYRHEHKIIFNCLVNQYSKLSRTDFIALVEELRTTGELQKIGTEAVFALPQIANTTAYAEYYSKIIKDIADKRRLNDITAKILADTRAGLKTPAQIIADATAEFNKIQPVEKNNFIDVKIYVMHKWYKTIEDNQKYADRSTGFSNIDEQQIFRDGLYILGATPAAGKTTFAWQMADQLASLGETVIFFSYEMAAEQLVSKTFARKLYLKNPHDPQATLTAAQISKGKWVDQIEEIQREIYFSNCNLQILQMQNETIDDLLAEIRPLCTNVEKAPIVFIDYLQILPPVGKEDDKQKVDNALRKLKAFQQDTHTTFIVISSFNRGNYYNSIGYESFKDSGNIEYSADVIWGLQLYIVNTFKDAMGIKKMREEVDAANKQQPRQIQFKCLKNRFGANYDCYFNYYSAHDYFEPATEADFEPVDGPPEPNNSNADDKD